jgi:hypothetical protein
LNYKTLCGLLNGWQLYTVTKRGNKTLAWGNLKANRETKHTALMREPAPTALTAALFLCPLIEWDPKCMPSQQAWFKTEEGNFIPDRWCKFADGHIAIPESLAPAFVKQFHE